MTRQETDPMMAFYGRAELKTEVLTHLTWHREADKLVQGADYWKDGKGSAVGCTLESLRKAEGLKSIQRDSHKLYEKYLGVPIVLARLEDWFFEALPKGVAQQWPERFLSAIRPGADLSMVVPKFLYWLLTDPDGGVQAAVKRRPHIEPVVSAVSRLYERWIGGNKPSYTEWSEARTSAFPSASTAAYAYAAASTAAYAAASTAAYAAAYAAAAYADYAAAYAFAYADYAANANAAARIRSRQRQADYLITLLEAA